MNTDLKTYLAMLNNADIVYTLQSEDNGSTIVDVEQQGENRTLSDLGYNGFVSLHRFNDDGILTAVGGAE